MTYKKKTGKYYNIMTADGVLKNNTDPPPPSSGPGTTCLLLNCYGWCTEYEVVYGGD